MSLEGPQNADDQIFTPTEDVSDQKVVNVDGVPMKVVGYTTTEGNPGRMSVLEAVTPTDVRDSVVIQETRQVAAEEESSRVVLTSQEAQAMAQVLSGAATEIERKWKLRQLALKKGVDSEKLLREVNLYKISQVRQNENGELRHFHRTNIDNLMSMIQMRRMLSRSKLKELKPDIQLPGWSASDNVMMTRDRFDADGNLFSPGYAENEVVGASGGEVLLVFKDSIMQNETYDTMGRYPTVSDLPIEEYCEVILANSESDIEKIELALRENSISIPVRLKSEWKR